MNDEEALFEVWFQLYRVKQWRAVRPGRGLLEQPTPPPGFCMAQRGHFHAGWMARAGLHVVYADGSTSSDRADGAGGESRV